MSRMRKVTPDNLYYWCPADTDEWEHFHASSFRVCEACGVEVYNAQDDTGRYKARRPWQYIIAEEDELDLTGGQL